MVHQYQLNGYNIVLDTCSGGIHVVDEVAYDIIALYESHSPNEIVAAIMFRARKKNIRTRPCGRSCLSTGQPSPACIYAGVF